MTEKLVDSPQTIIEFQSRNVKRLKVVRITPEGEMVVIGGDNEQGKSSILDSIVYAFEGKRSFPKQIVRKGAADAEIMIKTQNLEIRRKINENGKAVLELRKDGVKVKNAQQTALDTLTHGISFDPEEFSRMDKTKQAEHLRKLIKLDMSDLETDYEREYNDRSDVNRDLQKQKAKLESMPFHPGIPDEEKSAADLMVELREIQQHNMQQERRQQELNDLRGERDRLTRDVEDWKKQIADLQAKVESAEQRIDKIVEKGQALRQEADAFVPKSEDNITRAMKTIEDTNRKVRENREWTKLETSVKNLNERSEQLSASLKSNLEERKRRMASVDMPIEGLAFDEQGFVTYKGIDFAECSSAEQTRVSTAIALRTNPDLPVILIRNGSLMGPKNRQIVLEMGAAAGAQVWMERVTTDKNEGIIIEDGSILSEPEKKQGNLSLN